MFGGVHHEKHTSLICSNLRSRHFENRFIQFALAWIRFSMVQLQSLTDCVPETGADGTSCSRLHTQFGNYLMNWCESQGI